MIVFSHVLIKIKEYWFIIFESVKTISFHQKSQTINNQILGQN